ncbi:MAG: nitroreductase family protein [Pseudomonadales bacterium]
MEFKAVLGIRRSIRFFDPDKPVERDKIQKVLEAMRIASCAVNAHWLRAIVVNRSEIPPDTLERLKTPVAGLVQELAPVHIYCYMDLGVVNRIKGSRLKHLVDVGALAPTHGWSHRFVDELVYPQILKPLTESAEYEYSAAFDCGGAGTQGLLTAFDEGLGACWTGFNAEPAAAMLCIPSDWRPLYVLNLGYRLESAEAGGQRPRPDFEELYFEGNANTPFQRDPRVVAELERDGMLMTPAPIPERMQEIRDLARQLGLPE